MEAQQIKQIINKFRGIEETDPMDQHKIKHFYINRAAKRSRMRINHGADARPFARVRSGIRTGTTLHFTMWMSDLRMKSTLQKKSTAKLADNIDDVPLATSFALLHGAGIRNVYDLTQADARDLLAVKGIGPKCLEAVKTCLASVNVGVRW